MTPMIVCDAIMLKHYEPGDGTRYRVMYSIGPSSVYVAIGAGDRIEGGYMLQRDTLGYHTRHIANAVNGNHVKDEVKRYFRDVVGYWREFGHANIYDRECPICSMVQPRTDTKVNAEWTSKVACLIALVAHASDVTAHYALPGLVYREKWDEVLELVKEWRDE
jgi:hypothetical protein